LGERPEDIQEPAVSVFAPVCGVADPSGPPNPVPVGLVPVQTKLTGGTMLVARSRLIWWTSTPDQSPAVVVLVVTSVPLDKYTGVLA